MHETIPKLKGPARGLYARHLVARAAHMTDVYFGIPWATVLERNRGPGVCRARRWAAWYLHSQGLSGREIAPLINRSCWKFVQEMIRIAADESRSGRVDARQVLRSAESL